jgi:AcrR family transcriptional regulator
MSNPREPSALRPRKSPRQPRSAVTVASILEAAAQVLEAAGFDGFNTNAVARRAGVSVGSLYQYFPNKQALTIALIRRETERFQADAVRALEEPSGAAAMSHFIAAAVRHQLRRPVLARLLDVEEGRPEFRGELSGLQSFQQLLLAIIRRHDMPAPECAELAAEDIVAMMRGMIDAAGERGERDLADLGRRVRAAVFGYLAGTACRDGFADEPVRKCEQAKGR